MSPRYKISKRRGTCELIYYDTEGNRHRHTLGTDDESEAALRAPTIFAELTRPRGKSVEELWVAYTYENSGKAIITPRVTTWKALRARFARLDANRISVADCEAHIDQRRAIGRKDGTIYTELSHLRTTLRWAEKRGLIDRAPYIKR